MTPTMNCTPPAQTLTPRILVVDDEPTLIELIQDVVCHDINCRVLTARSIKEAREILAHEPVELLVADINLPDGDGTSLLPALRSMQPYASAIVITGAPSVDGAISAMRNGALDFVPKPFSANHLADRVRRALQRQAAVVKSERRLGRLRDAVRRLNESRKLVSKKVDLLCNDLITAYGELARQLDSVRTQEGFRKFLAESKDLEQLLCHAMDWILRQVGYTNIAIWLAADDSDFQLGAYMKYTIPGDKELSDAMKAGLIPLVLREGLVHLAGEDEVQNTLSERELDYLADQTITGINCTYLGEPLAAIVVFRDQSKPFTHDEVEMLKAVSPIFAVALASLVHGPQKPEHGGSPFYDGESLNDGDDHRARDDEPRERKPDAADWWKRGEDPPF